MMSHHVPSSAQQNLGYHGNQSGLARAATVTQRHVDMLNCQHFKSLHCKYSIVGSEFSSKVIYDRISSRHASFDIPIISSHAY